MTRHEAFRECIENTIRLFYNSSLPEEAKPVESPKTLRQSTTTLAFAVTALELPHFYLRGDMSEVWAQDFEKARNELASEFKVALDYFA